MGLKLDDHSSALDKGVKRILATVTCTERMKKEKGKKKKERGKVAGTSIRPDESELLGNRLRPAGPQTATRKKPPFEGGYEGVNTATNWQNLLGAGCRVAPRRRRRLEAPAKPTRPSGTLPQKGGPFLPSAPNHE